MSLSMLMWDIETANTQELRKDLDKYKTKSSRKGILQTALDDMGLPSTPEDVEYWYEQAYPEEPNDTEG